jgi:ribonuclease HII
MQILIESQQDKNYYKDERSQAGTMKGILADTIVVGIDEAGLGPILGPLVVSAATFSVPEGNSDKSLADMWQLLGESIASNKKHLAGRLLICDSKKAYNPTIGTGHLEKTVLSCLKCLGKSAFTVAELVDSLGPECKVKILESPWFKNIAQQKINFNADEISISAGALERNLEKNGMALIGLKSFCLDAGYFNELIGKIRNKSSVVFQIVCRLINETINGTQHRNYHFKIDRQGGRMRYAQPLMTMFGGMDLKVLEENDNISSYQLSTSYKMVKLDFAVGADDIYLPTSLASMTSKYLREQLMAALNGYFLERCSQLKPTAGYWTDGKRFLNDLKTIAPQIQYDPRQLIRCR